MHSTLDGGTDIDETLYGELLLSVTGGLVGGMVLFRLSLGLIRKTYQWIGRNLNHAP
jgi:hypothetical protein